MMSLNESILGYKSSIFYRLLRKFGWNRKDQELLGYLEDAINKDAINKDAIKYFEELSEKIDSNLHLPVVKILVNARREIYSYLLYENPVALSEEQRAQVIWRENLYFVKKDTDVLNKIDVKLAGNVLIQKIRNFFSPNLKLEREKIMQPVRDQLTLLESTPSDLRSFQQNFTNYLKSLHASIAALSGKTPQQGWHKELSFELKLLLAFNLKQMVLKSNNNGEANYQAKFGNEAIRDIYSICELDLGINNPVTLQLKHLQSENSYSDSEPAILNNVVNPSNLSGQPEPVQPQILQQVISSSEEEPSALRVSKDDDNTQQILLSENRASATTPQETVAVVGAGLLGTISAIYLAKAGYKVLLIEEQQNIMTVSSKIPVHLHSGGLYIDINAAKDMEAAKHCLHDSINFITALPFAIVKRPTVFAIAALDDQEKLPHLGNMTQLMYEATLLYKKANPTSVLIPPHEIENYKAQAKTAQQQKWQNLKAGFEILKKEYEKIVAASGKEPFGASQCFYKAYEQFEFESLHQNNQVPTQAPAFDDSRAWAQQMARVANVKKVLGFVVTSEVGLNMLETNANLETLLTELERTGNLSRIYGHKVETIKKTEESMQLTISQASRPLQVNHVVNATGHHGKILDDQMGVVNEWVIDMKGVTIVTLKDNTFDHTPEIFIFGTATGMAHIGRHDNSIAGLNFACPLATNATYIADAKIVIEKKDQIEIHKVLLKLEKDYLVLKPTDKMLLERGQNVIDLASFYFPGLSLAAAPLAYFVGVVSTIGNDLNARTSQEVYHAQKGYISANIVKGGGAVSTAMRIVSIIENHSGKNENEQNFPKGSHSEVSGKFILKADGYKLILANNREAVKTLFFAAQSAVPASDNAVPASDNNNIEELQNPAFSMSMI
jgi:2-polyprenyl-6-methoxyphenol hydroxylase-like FAD-dependent oxidoreductase